MSKTKKKKSCPAFDILARKSYNASTPPTNAPTKANPASFPLRHPLLGVLLALVPPPADVAVPLLTVFGTTVPDAPVTAVVVAEALAREAKLTVFRVEGGGPVTLTVTVSGGKVIVDTSAVPPHVSTKASCVVFNACKEDEGMKLTVDEVFRYKNIVGGRASRKDTVNALLDFIGDSNGANAVDSRARLS